MFGKWIGQCVSVFAEPGTEYQMPVGSDIRAIVMRASGDLVLAGEGGRYFRVTDARGIWQQLNDIFADSETVNGVLGELDIELKNSCGPGR